jgi:hypothetical protein
LRRRGVLGDVEEDVLDEVLHCCVGSAEEERLGGRGVELEGDGWEEIGRSSVVVVVGVSAGSDECET